MSSAVLRVPSVVEIPRLAPERFLLRTPPRLSCPRPPLSSAIVPYSISFKIVREQCVVRSIVLSVSISMRSDWASRWSARQFGSRKLPFGLVVSFHSSAFPRLLRVAFPQLPSVVAVVRRIVLCSTAVIGNNAPSTVPGPQFPRQLGTP